MYFDVEYILRFISLINKLAIVLFSPFSCLDGTLTEGKDEKYILNISYVVT